MPKQKGESRSQLSTKSFFDKYADLLTELLRTPSDPVSLKASAGTGIPYLLAIHHLNEVGFTPLLKAAQRDNHPEAFKEILQILIHSLGVETPKGVFTPKPKTGKPGRPISIESVRIYSKWVEIGEPSPYRSDLAKAVYGVSFNKASGLDRRRMRDRCRNAVDRHLDRLIADLKNKLAEQEKELAELRERLAQS
jgi:hypothetical protein